MSAAVGGCEGLHARAVHLRGGAGVPVVCLVGAGGKTSAMFALARRYAADGRRVLVTTTTHILDPEAGSDREGRGFAPLMLIPDPTSPSALAWIAAAGPHVVLASERSANGRKLVGIPPDSIAALAKLFDVVLVEADGARGRPIKAPAAHEPVIPSGCTTVIGVVGLDALAAPMDERVVHRPELFGPLVGCANGSPIRAVHVARLAASSEGLFKSAPAGAQRLLLLNKADAVGGEAAEACANAVAASAACDAVFLCSMEAPA